MLILGLTGGIASGKSTVCQMLKAKGCRIIDADQVAHELILKGQPCYEPVAREFGEGILASCGEISRPKLGALIFDNPALLDKLNRILHPEVIRTILERLDTMAREATEATVVVDASMMIESGFYTRFPQLVLVICDPDQQVERLVQRSGMTAEQARQRIGLQMPLEEKRRYATEIIDNSGSLDATRQQVDALIERLER